MQRLIRRPDLVDSRGPSGDLEAVYDPVFDRRIEIGPVARSLLGRLDGSLDANELVATVADEKRLEPAYVEVRLRALLLMLAIEGTGAAILERARRARSQPPELLFLEGTRFQCQGSGACCAGYSFGPLTKADRARLEALDLAGAGLGPGPYTTARPLGDGEVAHFLAETADGRCVFLRGAHCSLHATFGGDSKPGLCQLYPMRLLPTIEGVKVVDGGECASFATSARAGDLVASEEARLRALLPDVPRIEHSPVLLEPDLPCDMGYVLEIQRTASERLAALSPIGEALDATLRFVHGAAAALARCELEPGGPERALAAHASQPTSTALPPADPAALVALLDDFLGLTLPSAAAKDPHGSAFAAILAAAIPIARAAADPEAVLTLDHQRVARVAATRDLDEPLRLAVRHAVWGDRLAPSGRLRAGMARLGVGTFLAAVGARLHAIGTGSDHVRAEDTSFGLATVNRVLRRPGAGSLLVKHEPAAWGIAVAAVALLASPQGK